MTTTAERVSAPPTTAAGGPAVAGTGALVRFALRRDRIRLPVWIAVGAAMVAFQSVGSQTIYDTPEALAAVRASIGSNAASIALAGPPVGLDTIGGEVTFEISGFAILICSLMAMFTVGRHTRADEETGRTELIRSARVGRHAPLLAAVTVAGLACVALALASGAAATATGLAATGSFMLGASIGAGGLVFTGITAVVAQVTSTARATHGIVGLLFGVFFVLRAVGDVNGNWLIWTSPIGWAQAVHPFAGNRWAPLLLCAVVAVALVAVAVALLDHRDLGSGMLTDRPGTPHAGRSLRSPLGLALRLQRGSLIGWTASLALLGLVYGGLAESVETLLADNEQAKAFFPDITAAGLVDGYLATTFSINALLAAAYGVSSVLRARTEEAAGRAEPVLATATGRFTWLAGHVVIALLGSFLLLAASGAATAGIRVVATGDVEQFGRLFDAALIYGPAVWAVAAVAVALVGLAPRAAVAGAWAFVAYVVIVAMFAQALDWPDWVDDASPIGWTPLAPIEDWTLVPAVGLAAAVLALLALGFSGFRQRDLTTG